MKNSTHQVIARPSWTDEELADQCDALISKLCKTGGRAFLMQVPVNANEDSDMLLSELVSRFRDKIKPE